MAKTPRNEQETILLYDVELDRWEVYSNYALHIRKYKDKVIPKREEFYADGSEKLIDGIIEGSVSVRGKIKLTDEERKERAKRLQKARES